eukprot:166941_1
MHTARRKAVDGKRGQRRLLAKTVLTNPVLGCSNSVTQAVTQGELSSRSDGGGVFGARDDPTIDRYALVPDNGDGEVQIPDGSIAVSLELFYSLIGALAAVALTLLVGALFGVYKMLCCQRIYRRDSTLLFKEWQDVDAKVKNLEVQKTLTKANSKEEAKFTKMIQRKQKEQHAVFKKLGNALAAEKKKDEAAKKVLEGKTQSEGVVKKLAALQEKAEKRDKITASITTTSLVPSPLVGKDGKTGNCFGWCKKEKDKKDDNTCLKKWCF